MESGRLELKDQQNFLATIRMAVNRRRPIIISAPGPAVSPRLDFARSVATGLKSNPRCLDCRFLYDAPGSELYEEITRQPEYYPTRTEAGILARWAETIAGITGPVNLLEFGSGSSAKTGFLLSAYRKHVSPITYLPVDVSRTALQAASADIVSNFPQVMTIGIHGTYEVAFPLLEGLSPVMVVFLGSTIGNFDRARTEKFFRALSSHLSPGDFFLLGVDLVKDPSILEAAYNDSAGITEAFTRNLFKRMNRELGSRIDVRCIDHVALWNPMMEQIEIDALFTRMQTIRIAPLNLNFDIQAGEGVRTEISRKFRTSSLSVQLISAGFQIRRIFSDSKEWFSLLLLEKTPMPGQSDLDPLS